MKGEMNWATTIPIILILIVNIIFMIEMNLNPSEYDNHFACNSTTPTIGEVSNNITYSNVRILPDNPFVAVILFGIAVFGIFLPFIITKGDNILSDIFERILKGSMIIKILAIIGVLALMSFSAAYSAIFLIDIISLVPVSCAGWIWIFLDFILSIFAVLLGMLENA